MSKEKEETIEQVNELNKINKEQQVQIEILQRQLEQEKSFANEAANKAEGSYKHY